MAKKMIFRGACCALVTPMKSGKIDYEALGALIERQILGGTEALAVAGTTGEAPTLKDGERSELFAFVKQKVAGRVKIIFGTGTNDTDEAIRRTKEATRIGCDAVLVVTPHYNKGTHPGVVEHYERLAALSDTPIILYNVPGRTGVNLTLKQLEMLAKRESIVGIKEAGDSADRLTELASFGSELYLYAGCDSQIYEVLALGGKGVISVVSNIYPEKISDICRSYFIGRRRRSLTGQLAILPFTKLMFAETNPSPIKYAMSLVGLSSPEVRLPLLPPGQALMAEISEEVARLEAERQGFLAKITTRGEV